MQTCIKSKFVINAFHFCFIIGFVKATKTDTK